MKSANLRIALSAAIAIALVLGVVAISFGAANVGSKAPAFKLTSISNKTMTLDEIRKDPDRKNAERVVLIDFWATWCPHCAKELPILQSLNDKYGKKGFAVVGVGLDNGGISTVKPFLNERKITYINLVDPSSTAAREYGVRPIPAMFLVDKKGVIRYTHIGETDESVLDKEIKSLL